MIRVYLDHNIIDRFDKGESAYLGPLLANKGFLPIISLASVDEIFRGGDEDRSRRNIESLKRLGVRYIHSGPDESHMSISELDYKNMHQKWVEMQSHVGPLNDSHFAFISTLFRGNMPEAIQDMDQAVSAQITWIKSNYDKFPNAHPQMNKVLSSPEEYRELCRQLIHLKTLLPFTPKEINNIPENSVFWTCVDKLKSATDANLQLIGNFIQNEIESAKTIDDQFTIVFLWLNLFGYYPDDLTRIDRVRSNFSDANHATYAIACDAMLTLDKKFAKRAAAAMGALELKTEVSTDANELLHRIAALSGHSR
ncbi:MAG TPA: hypothetical protein VMW89_05815 [Desulfatiglandales bacterium]|nr:hypothetical protein [Desulfatiglandales bacterium]